MYKIHVKGNLFYIDDLTSQIRYEGLAKEVRPKVLEINSDGFSFDNVNNWSNTKVIYFNEIDLTDADYSDIATFKGWYEQELGKSSPSDGGGEPIEDIYTPTVKVNTYSNDTMSTNETITLTIRGIFLDYVDNIFVTGQDIAGIVVTENVKKYNKIELELTSNNIEQQLTINLESPNNTETVTVDVSELITVIPSTTGTGQSLWFKDSGSNDAVLTDGGFSASISGNGWNEHGSYGQMSSLVELKTYMEVSNLTTPTTGYCYVSFGDRQDSSTNIYPSFFLNGSSMEVRGHNDQFLAQNIQVSVGDEMVITQNPNLFRLELNGQIVAEDTSAAPTTDIYVNFTAWQTTSFINIKSEIKQ